MQGRVITKKFFNRQTCVVAENLIGKYLVRRRGRKIIAAMITEVEAYDGVKDRASHAHKGRTERNKVMFGPAGFWYVYFVYGMHWMLNVVTGDRGYPAAVLIRGVQGVSGPGRVTKFFHINGSFSEKPSAKASGLWIEDRGAAVEKSAIKKITRIGVAYAGPVWSKKKYRFLYDNKS